MLPYVLAAIALAAFIVGLCFWSKRRKEHKEFEEMSQNKRRDDALAEALRNPNASRKASGAKGPMEITWDDKAVNQRGMSSASLMIELTEFSAYSRRKYVFRAEQRVTIGSGKDCQLVLPREGVEERHCEILLNGKRFCVRSLSNAKTVLVRKKKSVLVGTEGIYLNNGDRIQLGVSEISFRSFSG